MAGVRGAAAGAKRGSDGRRADLRVRTGAARRHQHRWHDRRLVPVPARCTWTDLQPDHQSDQGDQSGRVRCELETAGYDRVGVARRVVTSTERDPRLEKQRSEMRVTALLDSPWTALS